MAAKHKAKGAPPIPQASGNPSAPGKYTAGLVEKISLAVEHSTKLIAYDLGDQTPRWSSWLRANWNHTQGRYPVLGSTPDPKRERGLYGDFVKPILGNVELDGTLPQYFYNNVSYAEDVAMGNYPGVQDDIPIDWYFQIEQHHASGKYMKVAIAYANRTLGDG
jgi:hypothetical protein